MAEEVVEEVVEEVAEEEVEAEAVQECPFNPPLKEMLENKEHCLRNSKGIAPKPKNLSKTCEATFA